MNQPLKLFTLGNVRILRANDQPVDLKSQKAIALLVYLAVNRRTFPREVLANLLWDERSQSQALTNLRYLLTILRKEMGEYLNIERNIVGIQPNAEVWLDAAALGEGLFALLQQGNLRTAEAAEELAQTLELYQGEFLQGFSVADCTGFQEKRFRYPSCPKFLTRWRCTHKIVWISWISGIYP